MVKKMILDTKQFLTIGELCERLNVTRDTLLAWRKNGINGRKLPVRRAGRRVYFDHAEVLEFLGWEDRDTGDAAKA